MKLTLAILTLTILSSFFQLASSREYGGRWTDQSKAEVAWKIIDHVRTEQKDRLKKLQAFAPGSAPKLSFSNFPSERGKEGAEEKQEFLAGEMRRSEHEKFLQGINENLQANQDLLYPIEEAALKTWKPKAGALTPAASKPHTAKILGNEVTAIQLGVILDSSPSMREVIDPLRAEIKKNFSYCYFVEAAGAYLAPPGLRGQSLTRTSSISDGQLLTQVVDNSWFYADPPSHLNPFDSKWHSPPRLDCLADLGTCFPEWPRLTRDPFGAFLSMINLLETDTIYWFSDFKDSSPDQGIKLITQAMRDKKIRLYLVSSSRKPNKVLVEYAEESGGSYERKRVR